MGIYYEVDAMAFSELPTGPRRYMVSLLGRKGYLIYLAWDPGTCICIDM